MLCKRILCCVRIAGQLRVRTCLRLWFVCLGGIRGEWWCMRCWSVCLLACVCVCGFDIELGRLHLLRVWQADALTQHTHTCDMNKSPFVSTLFAYMRSHTCDNVHAHANSVAISGEYMYICVLFALDVHNMCAGSETTVRACATSRGFSAANGYQWMYYPDTHTPRPESWYSCQLEYAQFCQKVIHMEATRTHIHTHTRTPHAIELNPCLQRASCGIHRKITICFSSFLTRARSHQLLKWAIIPI